jgi:anti-anti-sigma factor
MDVGEDDGAEATVEVEELGGHVVVRAVGELDLSNAWRLEQSLEPFTARGPLKSVVFDLSGLRFMDSSVLAVMLRFVGRGTTVRLRSPSTVIREVINATGLSDVLPIEA